MIGPKMSWQRLHLLAVTSLAAIACAVLLIATATETAATAPPSTAASTAASASYLVEAPVDRTITDGRITESSGLAPSLLHPGVLWTHNDSGNPPRIYAIGASGSTRAALTLGSEPAVDWEGIATLRFPAGPGSGGRALIAVGDIGDNNAVRSSLRIAIVLEPQQLQSASVKPVRVLRLRYPGGPRDAEALLADPRTGRLYIVSKTLFGSELYAVPKALWPSSGSMPTGTSQVTSMTRVASLTAGLITDGGFLPDGRMLLRGYGAAFVVQGPGAVHGGMLSTLAKATLPAQDQGESIAVLSGGREALIGSEGRREPVFRIPVPVDASNQSGPSPAGPGASPSRPDGEGTPNEAASPAAASEKKATASRTSSGIGDLRVWTAIIGGALALAALTGATVMFWNRRR